MDLNDYRRLLPIAKNRLDDELEIQSGFHFHVHQLVSRKALERDKARAQRDLVYSRVAARLEKEAEGKLSESKLDRMVKGDDEYIRARHKFYEAEQAVTEAEGLRDAWQQRSYALTALSDLYTREYYSRDSTYENPKRKQYDDLVNDTEAGDLTKVSRRSERKRL